MRVLLIGYGNPGRWDDGLGPAFASAVERLSLADITVHIPYQLQVEDALLLKDCDAVLFADATIHGEQAFFFGTLPAVGEPTFSTHSVQPGALLAMAREYFSIQPRAYLFAIRGYRFNDFGEGLTTEAQKNLEACLGFAVPVIERREFEKAAMGIYDPHNQKAQRASG